ncbi:MAG: ATP-binding cassette domain-containing protein, partial [Geminicoccaceae bacterium]
MSERDETILELDRVVTLFGGEKPFLRERRPLVHAVDGVSFGLRRGEIFGLVGESGCGKSTLGRTILGIQRETEGTIRLDGQVVSGRVPKAARRARREIQYVYQDPGAALDPWWSIGRSLAEALKIPDVAARAERERRIDKVLDAVVLGLT